MEGKNHFHSDKEKIIYSCFIICITYKIKLQNFEIKFYFVMQAWLQTPNSPASVCKCRCAPPRSEVILLMKIFENENPCIILGCYHSFLWSLCTYFPPCTYFFHLLFLWAWRELMTAEVAHLFNCTHFNLFLFEINKLIKVFCFNWPNSETKNTNTNSLTPLL